jgi:hypothetical protein
LVSVFVRKRTIQRSTQRFVCPDTLLVRSRVSARAELTRWLAAHAAKVELLISPDYSGEGQADRGAVGDLLRQAEEPSDLPDRCRRLPLQQRPGMSASPLELVVDVDA